MEREKEGGKGGRGTKRPARVAQRAVAAAKGVRPEFPAALLSARRAARRTAIPPLGRAGANLELTPSTMEPFKFAETARNKNGTDAAAAAAAAAKLAKRLE